MVIKNKHVCKMLIEVDENKITDIMAKKLTKVFSFFFYGIN